MRVSRAILNPRSKIFRLTLPRRLGYAESSMSKGHGLAPPEDVAEFTHGMAVQVRAVSLAETLPPPADDLLNRYPLSTLSQGLGCHPSTVSKYRAGVRVPTLEQAVRLAQVLGVSVDRVCRALPGLRARMAA